MEWWGAEAGSGGQRVQRDGELVFNGTEVQLGKVKRLWRWMGGWLHNSKSGLNATELHT